MSYATDHESRVGRSDLLRILGVAFGLAVVIGGTIGVGILRTPGAVVAQLGDGRLAILVWIAGGVYALLGASALADLVTTIPKSGGFYVFARHALGDAVGFAVGWADWFSMCAALAYAAIAFSEFLGLLYPDAGLLAPGPGAVVLIGFAVLQLAGMRVNDRVQQWTSFAKALAFLILIAVLFTAPAATTGSGPAPGAGLTGAFVAMIIALQLVVGAYDGWQGAMYFAGEDTNPSRNLPRALIGGVAIVIVVYLLVNAAFLRVLPLDRLASSSLPAADAATIALGPGGSRVITWLAALSLLPLINAVMLSGTRVLWAMGHDRLLPPAVGRVSPRGTPLIGLSATTVAALSLLAVQRFEVISAVMAFFAVSGYVGAFVALLVIHRKEPDLPRPFRSWGYPWTTLVVLVGALTLLAGLVVSAPFASAIAIGVLLASYPVYRATRTSRRSVRL